MLFLRFLFFDLSVHRLYWFNRFL